MPLPHPVMLVTGGGTGIGAATAELAAADGWTVVVTGRRPEPLEQVAARCGADVRAADLADGAAVDALVADVVAAHGRLDAVVANAGVMSVGSVTRTDPADWDATLAVNLTSVYRLLRAALPHLVATHGSVVGVSSIAALRSGGEAVAYSVSKAGLVSLVLSVARDYGSAGVRANVVCPGWVRTEMGDAEMAQFGTDVGLDVEGAYDAVTRLVPQARAAQPAEVARAILWLAGPEASYVNGATLVVDGGTVIVDPGTVGFDFDVRSRQPGPSA